MFRVQVWQVLSFRVTHLLRSNDVYPAADVALLCFSTFHLCWRQTSSAFNTLKLPKIPFHPIKCTLHVLKLFSPREFFDSNLSSVYQPRECKLCEQLSTQAVIKAQGIVSQMTKLKRVTKAILRVPNRLFFPRINLPSQMGQQLAQANQTTQANRLSSVH